VRVGYHPVNCMTAVTYTFNYVRPRFVLVLFRK
jgi:hypothetical protein